MRKNNRRRKLKRKMIRFGFCIILLLLICLVIKGITKAAVGETAGLKALVSGDVEVLGNKTAEEETRFTVCIDAGHGGKDNGSDYQKRYEKNDNLKLALLVEKYLKEEKIKVVMTRTEDTFLKLSKRCKIANDAEADYMVSLHRNTGNGTGVESWVYSQADEETLALAENIQEYLSEVGIQRNRGVKKGTQVSETKDYYITKSAKMPTCIIELGFLNNSKDNQLYDDNLEEYAKAIAQAIIATEEAKTSDPDKTQEKEIDEDDTIVEKIDEPEKEDETAQNNTSHTIENTPIANVESLSNELMEWGQGVNADEKNRPLSAIAYQETYGGYNANFIGEEKQVIYLTLDEGYEAGFTPAFLDTLKEKDVQAVFFVTKSYAESNAEYVQRMIDEGHAIGNHSVTHPSAGLPSQSIEQQQAEVNENHAYIKEQFGYEMHLFRYPAGKFSEQSLAIVNNCNYKSVFWSFAYLDYDVNNQPNEQESLEKLMSRLHPGAIYLLHAESQTNVAILGSFIDQARAAGYEFEIYG